MQALLFVSLLVAIVTVVFALQNNAPTTLSFLTWTFQGSLAVVILLAVAAGALASFLAATPGLLRQKWQLRACRRRIAELEAAAAKPPAGSAPAGTRQP